MNWRPDIPELRRRRSREAQPSGIYYGNTFKDFVNQPEPRYIRVYRWWDGITSDPMFWRLLVYRIALGIVVVAAAL